jgi:CDP-diacylglycerol--serine O-phosphatidyltransferase
LPNILTFINLSLGVIAILLTVTDNSTNALINASLLVMLAALTDRFDGHVARKLGVSSDLGKELDSLSDLISFCVAPVIISWKISWIVLFNQMGSNVNFLILLVLAFPIAGAYRLARFNVTTLQNLFQGVPTTIAGAFLSIINLYNCFEVLRGNYTIINAMVTFCIINILSYLMVSKFKIKKI